MSKCSTNNISLGSFAPCDEISTSIIATVTGIWIAEVKFNGVLLRKEISAIEGEELKIPNSWPENLLLSMQLFKPDGTHYDDNNYLFKINLTLNI